MIKNQPKIRCYFPQYKCCGNAHCRLYNQCSKLSLLNIPICYNHHLPYEYCDKKSNIDKQQHRRLYVFYNTLWGDFKERRQKFFKEYYEMNKKKLCREQKERYKKKHPPKDINDLPFEPDCCNLDCFNCTYTDCILPENFKKQYYYKRFCENNPDYFALYRQNNRELLRKKSKIYYENNKDAILKRQKLHRSKPDVKQSRKEYDAKYRKEHPEATKEKQRRYYEKHKDEINAKKRAKRQLKNLDK